MRFLQIGVFLPSLQICQVYKVIFRILLGCWMFEDSFYTLEGRVFDMLEAKLGKIHDAEEINKYIESVVKAVDPAADKAKIERITADAKKFEPIDKYLSDETVEDIMV